MRRLGLVLLVALLVGSSFAQAAPRYGDYEAAAPDEGPIQAEAQAAVDLLASALSAAAAGDYGVAERDIRRATGIVDRLEAVADARPGVWSASVAARYTESLDSLRDGALMTATGLFDLETALTSEAIDRADHAVGQGLIRLEKAARGLEDTSLTADLDGEWEAASEARSEARRTSGERADRLDEALLQVAGAGMDRDRIRELAKAARFNETARDRLQDLQENASGDAARALADVLDDVDDSPTTSRWDPLVRLHTAEPGVEAGDPVTLQGALFTGRFTENATVVLTVHGESIATFRPGAGPFTRTVETPSDLDPGPHTLTASVRPPETSEVVANTTTTLWIQEPTRLSIDPATRNVPEGDPIAFTLHLAGPDGPIPNATLSLHVGPVAARPTTNATGSVQLAGRIPDLEPGPVPLEARFPGTQRHAPSHDQVNLTYGTPTAGEASLEAEAGGLLPSEGLRPLAAAATAVLGLLGVAAASRWRGGGTGSGRKARVMAPEEIGEAPSWDDPSPEPGRGRAVKEAPRRSPPRSWITDLNPGRARFTPHSAEGLEAAVDGLQSHPSRDPELVERYRDVLAELAEDGYRVATLTPREVAQILSDLGYPGGTIEALTNLYEEARFGREAAPE